MKLRALFQGGKPFGETIIWNVGVGLFQDAKSSRLHGVNEGRRQPRFLERRHKREVRLHSVLPPQRSWRRRIRIKEDRFIWSWVSTEPLPKGDQLLVEHSFQLLVYRHRVILDAPVLKTCHFERLGAPLELLFDAGCPALPFGRCRP